MRSEAIYAPDGAGLKLKLPVPEGTLEGVPTLVGDMRVLPTTPRATAEIRRVSSVCHGLKDGEASCILMGLGTLAYARTGSELGAMFDGAKAGQKVYRVGGVLASAGTDAQHIGYAVPLPEPARGWGVALRGN